MHNTTRRVKRSRQSLSSIRPLGRLSEPGDVHISFVPSQDRRSSSSSHVPHRQPGRHDTLHGAMLIALVVVTLVLYFALWQLERSSFVSLPILPKRNVVTGDVLATSLLSSTPSPQATLIRYPPSTVVYGQVGAASAPGKSSNLSEPHSRIAEPLNTLGRIAPLVWSPRVTVVPGERDTNHSRFAQQADNPSYKDEITNLPSFDAAYCRGPCRFVLPVRVGEQESKARVHFMQLLALAKQLNRTIVLPNVGKSRMSACSEWPFGAYYDTTGFAHGDDSPVSPPAIDLEEFAKWVDGRPVPPSGFVASVNSAHQDRRDSLGDPDDVPFTVARTGVDQKILSCLGSRLARLRSSLPDMAVSISFDSRSLKTGSDPSTRLVQLLSNSPDMDPEPDLDLMMEPYQYISQYINSSYLSLADIDVLVLDYDLRHPLFHASEPALANFNLHYAPVLYDLADRLSEILGPFLGVHWRMETIPVQNLAWCAASLVSTLNTLLQDEATGKDVRHVWIATDYPLPLGPFVDDYLVLNTIENQSPLRSHGPSIKSSTFKAVSLEHDDAIGILIEAFQPGGDLDAWKLTDLVEQLRRYPYFQGRFELNETLLDDPGVFGIIDKLVIVQASAFVGGSEDCSKTSSYSKQVIEARQESLDAERGKGAIRNVVEYFGTW